MRDWVDLIACHERIQRLGYLVWGACGKDPGFSPKSLLEHARRSGHYSVPEVAELSFDGPPPDAEKLAWSWHEMMSEAEEAVTVLPPEEAGKCVIDAAGRLFRGTPKEARSAVKAGQLRFHSGSIRGVLPVIRA